MKELTEDYILCSDGYIQVVIGLNIEYKRFKGVTFLVWWPQYINDESGQKYLVSMQTVSDQVRRALHHIWPARSLMTNLTALPG